MAKKTIFTVGLDLPSNDFQYKSFHSNISLLDADIVLFQPNLIYKTDYSGTYNGKPSLTDTSSTECIESINHWKDELKTTFESGKTIFIFLNAYEEVYFKTGKQSFSGTGKNRQTTNLVQLMDSYLMLPLTFTSKKVAHGKNIKFTKEGSILKSYWDIVKDFSSYEVYFSIDKFKPLLQTKTGEKTVGALIKGKNGGSMIFIPPLDLPDDFTEYNEKTKQKLWSSKAIKFGKALVGQIVSIEKTIKSDSSQSPAPEWTNAKEFILDIEQKYIDEINKLENQILQIKTKLETKKELLVKSTISKKLLYENGKSLEAAIVDALQIIGFKAENYDDGESEFDIVFESREGRFIGEAEGKDASAINVTKFRQLESNIQEDFERATVTKHAKGVLFGNPHRLIHPKDRKDFFTTKAMSSAKRTGIALVNTHDLFEVVKYLKESKDKAYAKKVRDCFKNISGEIITFPKVKVK